MVLPLSGAAVPGYAQELEIDISSRLRYDRDAEGDDLDATFFTNIRINRLKANDYARYSMNLKLSGWGLWDLDTDDAFDEALDRRRNRITEAYAEIIDEKTFSRLRLGRQYLYDVDYFHFDGASLFLRENQPFSFRLYGGRAVSFYENAYNDWLAGAGATWKPSWRTSHHLDFVFLSEGGDLFFTPAWRWNQSWPGQWRTNTKLRGIDSDVRDFRLHASKYFESLDVGLDFDFYVQPSRRGSGNERRSRTLSSFGRILGARRPLYRISANLYKYFGRNWMVQTGGSVRRRLRGGRGDQYNSVESNSAYLSLTRFNLLIENLDLTLAGEIHDNELDRLDSITGELSYRPNRRWEFSLGSSYSKYKFDPIDFPTTLNGQDAEDADLLLENLRTLVYFIEARWRPTPNYDFFAEASWEDTDVVDGNAMTFRLGFHYHLRKSLERDDDSGERN